MKRRSFLSSMVAALFTPAVPALPMRSSELAKFPRTLIPDVDRVVNPPMIVDTAMVETDLDWLRPGALIRVREGVAVPMVIRQLPQ